MRLTIEADALRQAVAHAARALPPKPLVPVLAGLRLSTPEDGVLDAAAYDYETAARARAGAQVAEPGTVLVPGRLFAAVAAQLDGEVTLALDGTRLRVAGKGVKYAVPTMDERSYPDLPVPPAAVGTVDGPALARAVAVASTSARLGTGDPWWHGAVRFESAAGALLVGCTDGTTATRVELDAHPIAEGVDGELSAKTATAALAGATGRVGLLLGERQTGLEVDGHRWLVSARTDGWPRWRAMTDGALALPEGGRATIARAVLLKALGRCAAALTDTTDVTASARLELTPAGLSYSIATESGSELVGEAHLSSFEGTEIVLGLMPGLVRDAAAAGAGDLVSLNWSDSPMRPLIVRDVDGDGLHLVMPKRVHGSRFGAQQREEVSA